MDLNAAALTPHQSRTDSRRDGFKKGVEQDDARRRRTETTIQLRKDKKEGQMAKRRDISTLAMSAPANSGIEAAPMLLTPDSRGGFNHPSGLGNDPVNEQIERNKRLVMDDNADQWYIATQTFRRLLSIERNPPIEAVIKSGVVPRFVQFLTIETIPKLQFEACWALTNIASGTSDHTRFVVDAGAVPIFIHLLQSRDEDVREQAAWALGNIAGDSVQCRDFVLKNGALQALLTLGASFDSATRVSTIRNVTWTLSNLCRGKPAPDFEVVKHALPMLAQLVRWNDVETVTDACWALSYVSDGPDYRIQSVLELNVVPHLVALMTSTQATVQTPALRTIGNIVTGDDHQTQAVIAAGALPALLWLLDNQKRNIRKESCWTISNITAGTPHQIQEVINANIFPKLLSLLSSSEFDIQKEAAWAVSNATSGGNPEQIRYLCTIGVVTSLAPLLKVGDVKVLTVVLEGLENVFKSAKQYGYLEDLIRDFDTTDLEDLQNYENQSIYEKVLGLLEEFFEVEAEDGVAGVDMIDASGAYTFNGAMNHTQAPNGGFSF